MEGEDPSKHAAALKEMKRGEKRDRGANERFQAGDGTIKSAKVGPTVVVGRPIDKTAGWEVSPEMGVRYGTLADGTFNNRVPITKYHDTPVRRKNIHCATTMACVSIRRAS